MRLEDFTEEQLAFIGGLCFEATLQERARCADIANLYESQARPLGDEDVGECPLTAYFDGQKIAASNIEHDIRKGL